MWHTGDRMASNRLSQIWRDTFFHFSSFSLLYLSATTASSGHTSGHCTSRSIHLTITSCCMSSSRVSSPPLFRNRSTTSGRSAGMACVCGEFSDAIKLSHSWMTSGTVSKPLPDLYEDRVLAAVADVGKWVWLLFNCCCCCCWCPLDLFSCESRIKKSNSFGMSRWFRWCSCCLSSRLLTIGLVTQPIPLVSAIRLHTLLTMVSKSNGFSGSFSSDSESKFSTRSTE